MTTRNPAIARPTPGRTLVAGLAGGLAFLVGTFVTFALFGGSREGETGILFDPDTQHPKVIAAWKEIEPLPRVIDQPAAILAGMVLFAVAYSFLYRSIAAAWPSGTTARAARLAIVVWIGAVFSEFIGPFNVLHQPLYLSVVAWAFWAVPATAEAFAIATILERSSRDTAPAATATSPTSPTSPASPQPASADSH
jgi:hypothetical protein